MLDSVNTRCTVLKHVGQC